MDAFCRVCMLRKTQKILLADSRNGTQILDMLASVCGIHFKESPQLPHAICERCLAKLELAHAVAQEFRDQEMLRRNLWLADAWLVRLEEYQTMAREEPRSERLLKGLNASIAREKEICTSIPLENLENATAETVLKEELIIEDDSNQDDATSDQEKGEEEPCSAQVPATDSVLEEKIDETDKPNETQENQPDKGLPDKRKFKSLRRHEQIRKHPKLTCVQCKREYSDVRGFQCHVGWHNRRGLLCCSFCGENQVTPEAMKNHICPMASRIAKMVKLRLKSLKTFRCEECGHKFHNKKHYIIHRKRHEHIRKGTFKCDICFKCFGGKVSLGNHMREHNVLPVYRRTCEECGKELTSINAYNCHIYRHRKDRGGSFHCPKCDKNFTASQRLLNHKCNTREQSKDEEILTGSGTETVEDDSLHSNKTFCEVTVKEERFFDENPPATVKEEPTVESNLELEVPAAESSASTESNVPFGCEECGKKFTKEKLYQNHLQRHENIRKGMFQCDICQQYLGGSRYLREHKLNVHKPMPQWMQNCEECGRKFTTANSYRCHMRRHQNVRSGKYRCTACGKCMTHQAQLKGHKCSALNKQ
uniref:Putative zinc finger protein n=1 Tax=Culex tarsalis TaxID=7177 RepID=A0A1Q3EYM9_CULTA